MFHIDTLSNSWTAFRYESCYAECLQRLITSQANKLIPCRPRGLRNPRSHHGVFPSWFAIRHTVVPDVSCTKNHWIKEWKLTNFLWEMLRKRLIAEPSRNTSLSPTCLGAIGTLRWRKVLEKKPRFSQVWNFQVWCVAFRRMNAPSISRWMVNSFLRIFILCRYTLRKLSFPRASQNIRTVLLWCATK